MVIQYSRMGIEHINIIRKKVPQKQDNSVVEIVLIILLVIIFIIFLFVGG